MGALFVYILKSSVCLAVFYLFYRWLLSRETFHRFNRFALLGLLILSFALPGLEVSMGQPTSIQQEVVKLEKLFVPQVTTDQSLEIIITQPEPPAVYWSWQEVMLSIYLLGIVFFFFRNIYSLLRMLFLLRKSELKRLGNGITLVVHNSSLSPFSWIKYIVISASDLQQGGEEIIIHEQEHIRYCHSLDLLLAELTILFQWFNPAAWFFKQELQNIHEYQADESVLKHGIDAKQYQLLLIKKAVGTVRFNSLANSFNHSKLKKRITMMLKRKSNPWGRLKYLYVLPLVVIVVTAFARPEFSDELNRISELKVNDLVAVAEKKISESLLNEEVKTLPEVESPEQSNDVSVVNDTVILRDTVFIIRRDTVVIPASPPKEPAKASERVTSLKEFLDCHPYAWIVINQKEMRASEVHPEEYADKKGTIVSYPLDMSRRFGKRAAGGVLLINTDEEYFKNVIVKNKGYEAIVKALKGKSLVLDGQPVSPKLLKMISPCTIRSVNIEDERVKVSTDTGYWVEQFIQQHPDALVILEGKEIEIKDLKRTDYLGVETISSYGGDESAQFGPKAKDGALFIGVMSYHYQSDSPVNGLKEY